MLADGDHGYGNAMNVQRTVRAYGRAGAAAILIEDKITPRALTAAGKPCLPRDEARMKIRAAVEAAKESGILVLARTDCRPTQGIDEAVARIELFAAEGADIFLLDSPADDDEMRRAVAATAGRPSFSVLSPGGARATPTSAQAEALGFKIGTFPTGMLSPAAAGMQAGLAALRGGPVGGGRRPAAGRFPRGARLWRLRRCGEALHRARLTSCQAEAPGALRRALRNGILSTNQTIILFLSTMV